MGQERERALLVQGSDRWRAPRAPVEVGCDLAARHPVDEDRYGNIAQNADGDDALSFY